MAYFYVSPFSLQGPFLYFSINLRKCLNFQIQHWISYLVKIANELVIINFLLFLNF